MQAYNLQYVYEVALLLSLLVTSIVVWFLRMAVFSKTTCSTYLECANLELFWGTMPIFLLVVMCAVSTFALYVNDETYKSPALDVTVTGHQWYWSYKIAVGDEEGVLEWDSRLVPRSPFMDIGFADLTIADRPLMVPIKELIRVFVTSQDVIHSWGAPGLGVKIDAIPGRLTRGLFEMKLPGALWGMCTELCGAAHSMMPTVLEGVPWSVYESWSAYIAGPEDVSFWCNSVADLVRKTDEFKVAAGALVSLEIGVGNPNFPAIRFEDLVEYQNLMSSISRCKEAYGHLSDSMKSTVLVGLEDVLGDQVVRNLSKHDITIPMDEAIHLPSGGPIELPSGLPIELPSGEEVAVEVPTSEEVTVEALSKEESKDWFMEYMASSA